MTNVFSSPALLISTVVNLNRPGHYIHWGFIQISIANLIVIVAMIAVLIAAIVVPFPHRRARRR